MKYKALFLTTQPAAISAANFRARAINFTSCIINRQR
jgi:hypothetical protein